MATAVSSYPTHQSLGASAQQQALPASRELLQHAFLPYLTVRISEEKRRGNFQLVLTKDDFARTNRKDDFMSLLYDEQLQQMLCNALAGKNVQMKVIEDQKDPRNNEIVLLWGHEVIKQHEDVDRFQVSTPHDQQQAPFAAKSGVRFWGSLQLLLENVPVQTLVRENWQNKLLVMASADENLDSILNKMYRHNILSLPVLNNEGRVAGVIDVLDILCHFEEVFPWRRDTQRRQANYNYNQKMSEFFLKDAADLMALVHKRTTCVPSYSPILSAVKLLTNHHRLLVVDVTASTEQAGFAPDKVVGMVTQSDIVRFLAKHYMWLDDEYKQPLKQYDMISKDVFTISQMTPAWDAFKTIHQRGVHGVAVVNELGQLVANLSGSDIKGLTRASFDILRLPVIEYLTRNKRHQWFSVPVCVKETDTLKSLLMTFSNASVHRVFLTDQQGCPSGVITLSDMMKVIVRIAAKKNK